MKHAKPTPGSIFVRLQTVNGNTVRILPTMISFITSCGCGTKVFIEGRTEPLEVKEAPGVVARLIRRAYRALLILGLAGRWPFAGGFSFPFGACPSGFGAGFPFDADDDCDDDDDCCEDDTDNTRGAGLSGNVNI